MSVRFVALVVIAAVALGGLFVILRPDPPAANPQERAFEARIGGGGMEPENISVREGDRVTLNLTAESPVEVHVHGYDVEEEVEPDEASTLSFEAEQTGRFPIEDHGTEEEIGVLIVEPR